MDDYKFAVIFGSDNNENNTFDGQCLHYGDNVKGELHIKSLIDFIGEYYPNDKLLSQINIRHQPTIVAYFLVQMGHIVFLNSTELTKESLEKYGKSGLLFLPNEISGKQLSTLQNMILELTDYDLLINSDLKIEDGFLHSKTLNSMEHINPQMIEAIIRKNVGIKEELPNKCK